MGLIIGKIQERKEFDARALAKLVDFLRSDDCPSYLSKAHKKSMGLVETDDGDDEEEDEEAKAVEEEFKKIAGGDDDDSDVEEDDDEKLSRFDYPLHEACKTGSYYKVSNCLRNVRMSIELHDKEGKTALYIAAEKGSASIINLLCHAGAKTYITATFGWSPIHIACFCGHARAVETLIEKQAQINVRDDMGTTPLMLIASSFRLYREDFMTRNELTAREKAKAHAFDYNTREALLHRYGRRMDPLKTFEILCKLANGAEIYEEATVDIKLTLWEQQQGLPSSQTVRRRMDYEEEKDKAKASVLRYWEYEQHHIEIILMQTLLGKRNKRLETNAVDRTGRTALNYAAEDGYIQVISRLLTLKALIDHKDIMGQTALFSACKRGQTKALAILLIMDANVEIHDVFFTFPIHVTVEKMMTRLTSYLIEANSSVNVYDSQGRTPLMFAMDGNNSRMVRQGPHLDIVDARGWNIFIYAVETSLLPELGDVLLSFGDKIKSVVSWKDPQGSCALHHAVSCKRLYDVELLCRIIANVTEPDCNGNTALHLACLSGSGSILKHTLYFIYEGIQAPIDVPEPELTEEAKLRRELIKDLKPKCLKGCTVNEQMLVENSKMKTFRKLKEENRAAFEDTENATYITDPNAKGTVDYRNMQGETPLLLACSNGSLNCVITLLDNRSKIVADGAVVDYIGMNMIMHACTSRNLDLLNMLLINSNPKSYDNDDEKGVNPHLNFSAININAQDIHGCSALMIASREGNWNLIPSLVLAGASLNSKDWDDYTALHWACHEGEDESVAILLDCQANIDEIDRAMWTPLMIATHIGSNEACQLLIDQQADLLKRNNQGNTAYDLAKEGAIAQQDEMVADGNFRAIVDMLCDGMRDFDLATGMTNKSLKTGIDADGSFLLSLLHARYLTCPGIDSLGLNTYCYIQFAESPDDNPQIAVSACCFANPHPDWNETFAFVCKRLHPESFLMMHFLGVDELSTKEQMHLKPAHEDLHEEVRIQTTQVETGAIEQDQELDKKVLGYDEEEPIQIGDLASDLTQVERDRRLFAGDNPKRMKIKSAEDSIWLKLKNFHENVRKRGYSNATMPAVPKDHIPLGVIFMTFRSLRECLWTSGVFEYDRPLRMSQQARCRFDMEFRPRFWQPTSMVDKQARNQFTDPTRKDVEASDSFSMYEDGHRDYSGKMVEEDQRREEQNAIFAHPSIMFADRSDRPEAIERYLAGRPKKKNARSIFREFSRVFQFGKVAIKYENERYYVKKAWDAKVPKQTRIRGIKMEIPPAPMPAHLHVPPKIELAPDEERKLENSRFGTRF